MCSAASLLLILVVIAESFTNDFACARSVSESWATATEPSKLPDARNASRARHALHVVFDAPYEATDCFERTAPAIVSARTYLSQLL